MLRGIFLLFVLYLTAFTPLNAVDNPPFSSLSEPLVKSASFLEKLHLPKELHHRAKRFCKDVKESQKMGLSLMRDKNPKEAKRYLAKLRALHKEYLYLLHEIHKAIDEAITSNNAAAFYHLTTFALDGLLQNRALQERALAYYATIKSKQKSEFFEELESMSELLEASYEEVETEVNTQEFDSRNSKTTHKNTLYITTTSTPNSVDVYFNNANSFGVSVSVTPRYTNMQESAKTQRLFSLKAGEKRLYTRLKLTGERGSYSYSYSWTLGEMGVVHDEGYLYRLPYKKGTSYRISQGHNTQKTHKGRAAFAIDFAMPVGSRVYAAREGVVVRSKSDSNRGGGNPSYRKDGNFITIAHSDGSFATYYHLMQNGVLVRLGERVERGAHIGYSGNTGYSTGPHLHFAVFAATSARTTQTIAVRFSSAQGVFKTPIQGQFYTAK